MAIALMKNQWKFPKSISVRQHNTCLNFKIYVISITCWNYLLSYEFVVVKGHCRVVERRERNINVQTFNKRQSNNPSCWQMLHSVRLHEVLTCPCSSISLFVSLTFSNESGCFISCSPVKGASGCIHSLVGAGGSAFPDTSQVERWYA